MWIYLLRHGVAEAPRPGLADEDRSLTRDGLEGLHAASRAWGRLVTAPSVVFCSPYARARQTADVFSQTAAPSAALRVDATYTPSADPARAIAQLEEEMLSQTEGVAVIGHEPHLGYLLGSLLSAQPRQSVPLNTGMLVGVQTEGATSLVAGLRFALSQEAAASLT